MKATPAQVAAALKRALVLTSLAGIAMASGAEGRVAPQVSSPVPRFAPTSFWNAPIPDDQRMDPRSDELTKELVRQVATYGAWVNTDQYSVPIYRVGKNQPRVPVTMERSYSPSLRRAMRSVPIPPGARPAAGSDKQMVVWQPATDTFWEFWAMERRNGRWSAQWGGRMRDVSQKPGVFRQPPGWGATASGLPLSAGVVTPDELRSGHIDHPLAIAIVEPERDYWSEPAQRTDGYTWTAGITPVPEGARFRLDPNLDLTKLDLPRATRLMAEAAQRYGLIVRDKAGAVVFYMQDPVTMPRDPYPALFGHADSGTIARAFPWDHLQALPLVRRTWG